MRIIDGNANGKGITETQLSDLDAAPGQGLVEGVKRQALGSVRLAGSVPDTANGNCR